MLPPRASVRRNSGMRAGAMTKRRWIFVAASVLLVAAVVGTVGHYTRPGERSGGPTCSITCGTVNPTTCSSSCPPSQHSECHCDCYVGVCYDKCSCEDGAPPAPLPPPPSGCSYPTPFVCRCPGHAQSCCSCPGCHCTATGPICSVCEPGFPIDPHSTPTTADGGDGG